MPESVPQAAPLHPAPESVQVTPLFCGSFCTVALKVCVCPVWIDMLVAGETLTFTGTGGAVIVIVATALFVVSVTDVAVSVTVPGLGTVAGAV